MKKPRLFIGSSSESLEIAYELQRSLDESVEVTVWTQGIFVPSSYTWVDIEQTLPSFDFAAYILKGEDFLILRGQQYHAARDNVILELGYSIGTLGRSRTYLITPKEPEDLRLPSDLFGLKLLTFSANRSDNNMTAALGPTCQAIRKEIARLGPRQPDSA
ncbi:TIR domain-containing protein, partial [Rhodoplanes sp. SY1]|uniref:TIR domain-containing protein n=1 Tax=Rhodoplanes sp. SY1 TaxID=3166646 RepID=UPI0038B419F8